MIMVSGFRTRFLRLRLGGTGDPVSWRQGGVERLFLFLPLPALTGPLPSEK
jgi:hypothetical protein